MRKITPYPFDSNNLKLNYFSLCVPNWLLIGLATIMITVHDQAARSNLNLSLCFINVLLPHRLLRDNY